MSPYLIQEILFVFLTFQSILNIGRLGAPRSTDRQTDGADRTEGQIDKGEHCLKSSFGEREANNNR